MSSCFTPTSIVLAAVLPLIAASAEAQPSDGSADPVRSVSPPAVGSSAGPRVPTEVAAMRAELARLYEEVDALRASVTEMRAAMGLATQGQPPAHPAPAQPPQVTPETVDLLRAQIEEQAQTKVESSSRFPVKISGTILSNTFVNSAGANWLENPNLVGPPPADGGPAGSMSSTVRQSRVGVEVQSIDVGGWQAGGTMIADFFGGAPGFATGTVMGLPRLLYAFGRLDHGHTAIEVGQDHVVLAPRDPTSLAALSFPLLFRAGNLYLRAPQARVEQQIGGHWSLAAGIVAPVAGDTASTYDFAPPAGAGERSRRPALEARFGFRQGERDGGRELEAGVSTHYGWRRSGPTTAETWAVAGDFNVQIGRFGAAGEIYTADNAEPFGGGISQPGRASGGWAEGRVLLTATTRAVGGWGQDRPADALGRVLRQENRSAFGSIIFDLTPEVATSVEYRWLETKAGLVPVRRANHHVNAVLAVKF